MEWAELPYSPKGDAVRETLERRVWLDPSMPTTKLLKQNPGRWALVAHTKYQGGYSWYMKRGYKHAVRARDGRWDHYLKWPDDSE